MWRRAFGMSDGTRPSTREPWYRRQDVWLVVAAILLPFGWLLAAARITWAYARARRNGSDSTPTSESTPTEDRPESP